MQQATSEFTPANSDELWNAVRMYFKAKEKAKELYGPMNSWNTGKVTSLANLFRGRQKWDPEHHVEDCVSSWDTSQVTDMTGTFYMAAKFNSDISKWDTSKVESMENLFCGAHDFNHSIGKWNVGKVRNFQGMFRHAHDFNQEIGEWDTSSAEDMSSMFYDAQSFDSHIGNWNVQKVTTMYQLFYHALDFHQDIGKWDVSNVQDMQDMFASAGSFNYTYILDTWNFASLPKNATGHPSKPIIKGDHMYDKETGIYGRKHAMGKYSKMYSDKKKQKKAAERAGKEWSELDQEL